MNKHKTIVLGKRIFTIVERIYKMVTKPITVLNCLKTNTEM